MDKNYFTHYQLILGLEPWVLESLSINIGLEPWVLESDVLLSSTADLIVDHQRRIDCRSSISSQWGEWVC